MEVLLQINSVVNSIVWGPWMCAFLLGTGVYLTIILGVPQIRYFVLSFTNVFGKGARKGYGEEGTISPFAALATALAGTLGSGNIAGAATAIHLGGPGAAFWMWISALFGMTTKMVEVILATRFREKDEAGNWRGGSMYVLRAATGQKWLAWLFALFAALAAFGIGNMTQANSTAEAVKLGFGVPHIYTGIALAFLTALVVIGGLKSIANATVIIIPFMSVLYFAGGVILFVMNMDKLPAAFGAAFRYAFRDPMAMPGAIAGWSVRQAMIKGTARGIFSNEAGLGSAPMVHCTAITDHPVRQGTMGIFEVFLDTFVICTVTVISIIATGTLTGYPELTGAQLTLTAFSTVWGRTGAMFLAVSLALFAYSTVLAWYWYGETGATYILGVKVIPYYKALWIICIVLGAWGGSEFLRNIWDFADTLNGLMAIPNLIALWWVSGEVRRLVKDFDAKRARGELA
ncbi:sodium:alanine symporter family protein [Acetomicrobium sp.]|uniref:alanine/glycine:cation symporter family protein n=1 Tax=Acetomicrobium sp. TaxID=1872099 RepID=UPI002B263CE1|nr:sodium:alanine symporter family protein [Acetomicrobium sp.]